MIINQVTLLEKKLMRMMSETPSQEDLAIYLNVAKPEAHNVAVYFKIPFCVVRTKFGAILQYKIGMWQRKKRISRIA